MEALQTRCVEHNSLRRETVVRYYLVRESKFTHIVDSTVARSFRQAFNQLPGFAAISSRIRKDNSLVNFMASSSSTQECRQIYITVMVIDRALDMRTRRSWLLPTTAVATVLPSSRFIFGIPV
jgi:hypothetical protein